MGNRFKIGDVARYFPKVWDEELKRWVVDGSHSKCHWAYNGSLVIIREINDWAFGLSYAVEVVEMRDHISKGSRIPFYQAEEEELERVEGEN